MGINTIEILVVEDNIIDQKIISKVLVHAGHEPICLDDGEAAWEMINSTPIRFVITDWMLPSIEGVDLIKRIRSSDLEGYVYVILITGKTEIDDVISGLQAGADDYLTKPFHPYELEARVNVGQRSSSTGILYFELFTPLEQWVIDPSEYKYYFLVMLFLKYLTNV